ncbi:hypothetical protein ABQW53_22955, partial [Xanthomonas hortorum pv. hederae]
LHGLLLNMRRVVSRIYGALFRGSLVPHLPGGLADVANHVVPELQRRGLFRRDYAGRTLRDHLGLARPANRFSAR